MYICKSITNKTEKYNNKTKDRGEDIGDNKKKNRSNGLT